LTAPAFIRSANKSRLLVKEWNLSALASALAVSIWGRSGGISLLPEVRVAAAELRAWEVAAAQTSPWQVAAGPVGSPEPPSWAAAVMLGAVAGARRAAVGAMRDAAGAPNVQPWT